MPSVGAPFVAAREEVLDLYVEPPDPKQPLACFNKKPVILHAPTHPSLPPNLGHPVRLDDAYERVGTANAFVLVAPTWAGGMWRSPSDAPTTSTPSVYAG